MRERVVSAIALVAICGCLLEENGCFYRRHNTACKQRAAALQAKEDRLKRDAHEQLRIGTKKEDIVRFFAENNIPLTFTADEATGSISAVGCAPSGCGSDAYILGVRVKIDRTDTVIAEPYVGGIYTDCL